MLQQYNSTNHAKPRSIDFLPQYQRQRKYITQLKENKTFFLFTYISAEFTVTQMTIYIYIYQDYGVV